MFRSYNNQIDTWLDGRVSDMEKDVSLICVVDQFAGADFNLNDCGWIRNDLSSLARAQSQSEYNMIIQRLTEIEQTGGIPKDVSLEEAIRFIKPRWAQSPNEIETFMAMTNLAAFDELDAAYRKATAGKVDVSADASADASADVQDE